jgi:hypothetical protein
VRKPHERFSQPVDAITIVSRAKGPRTSLSPEVLARGRARVDAGEDIKKVAMELALEETWNVYGDHGQKGGER